MLYNTQNFSPYQRDPYNTSKEFTYIHGYGFTPPPPRVSEQHLIRSYANAIGLATLLMLFLSSILPRMLFNMFSLFLPSVRILRFQYVAPPAIFELIDGLTYSLSMLIPFFIYIAFVKIPLHSAAPMRRPNLSIALPGIAVAMGVSVVGIVASNFISILFSTFGIIPVAPQSSPDTTDGLAMLLYAINGMILPAFIEEIVFRGAILQSLRRFGDGFALLTSSILFSVIHGNFVQAPYAFLMGLVIGYFVLRTGSLWTGIFIHLFNNGISILFTFLDPYLSDRMYILIMFTLYAAYILAAVVASLYLVRQDSEMFQVREEKCPQLNQHKYLFFFGSAGMIACLLFIGFLSSQYFEVL